MGVVGTFRVGGKGLFIGRRERLSRSFTRTLQQGNCVQFDCESFCTSLFEAGDALMTRLKRLHTLRDL